MGGSHEYILPYLELNFFRTGTKKTLYEIWKGKRPKVKYFWVFGSKCFILNDRENLGKFDAKINEGIFLGYSVNSRAYIVFKKRTKTVMESINIVVGGAIPEIIVDEGGDVTNPKKNNEDGNSS